MVDMTEYATRVDHWQQSDLWYELAEAVQDVFDPERLVCIDYGCGPGRFTRELVIGGGAKFAQGFDPNPEMIARAESYPADPRRWSFSSSRLSLGTAHVAYCLQALGHMRSPVAELRTMAEHVETLVVLVPNLNYRRVRWLGNRLRGYRDDPTLQHQWTTWSFERLLEEVGDIVSIDLLGERYLGARSHLLAVVDVS